MRSIQDMMNLSGRKAFVTGGAGHVGLAACEALLESGATVTITDRDPNACEARRAQLAAAFPKERVAALSGDFGDELQVRKIVCAAIDAMSGLDIFVHCAAYVGTTDAAGWAVPFEQQTLDAWDAAMRINTGSAFVAVQEARQTLAQSGHGSVILVGSIYGVVGPDLGLYEGTKMANPAGYAASKGALLQLTRYLATTLAPQIRVNAISPGGIVRGQSQVFQERYVARTPLGRMAKEEDLKGAVAYLAGDLSSYVTGHNLVVDGGWTAW